MAGEFDALIRMLETRKRRQTEALRDTETQLESAFAMRKAAENAADAGQAQLALDRTVTELNRTSVPDPNLKGHKVRG